MVQKTFRNELGNKITIKIKKTKDRVKDLKFDAVNIQIIGPTSMSENIITRQEAEVLYQILNRFLKTL